MVLGSHLYLALITELIVQTSKIIIVHISQNNDEESNIMHISQNNDEEAAPAALTADASECFRKEEGNRFRSFK